MQTFCYLADLLSSYEMFHKLLVPFQMHLAYTFGIHPLILLSLYFRAVQSVHRPIIKQKTLKNQKHETLETLIGIEYHLFQMHEEETPLTSSVPHMLS